MREPEWIKHDGSAKCPVPAGHDVEREYYNGIRRSGRPETDADWRSVIRYRDWTAFEQNSAGEVPEWAKKRASDLVGSGHTFIAFARYIAAHENSGVPKLLTEAEWRALFSAGSFDEAYTYINERNLIAPEPEPVDPLREAVEAACRKQFAEGGDVVEYLTAELRARGVTMGKNNG